MGKFVKGQQELGNRLEDIGEKYIPLIDLLGEAFLTAASDGGVLEYAIRAVSIPLATFASAIGILLNGIRLAQLNGKEAAAENSWREGTRRLNEYYGTLKKYYHWEKYSNEDVIKGLKLKASMGDEYAVKALKYIQDQMNLNKKFGGDRLAILEEEEKMREAIRKLGSWDTISGKEGEKAAKERRKKHDEEMAMIQARSKATQDLGTEEDKTADKASEEAKKVAQSWEEVISQSQEAWEAMSISDKFQAMVNVSNTAAGAITDVFSSMAMYQQAIYDQKIAQLDSQMQRELEAAGVAEDTAVEKAEKELEAALAKGDAELIAEKEKAVERAKIEEKYQRQKAILEYKSQLASWNFQMASAIVQGIMAPLNALASGFQAPWFMLPWFPIAMATMAGVGSAVQVAAVAKSKPTPPKFEHGGIVPGNSFTGDKVPAMVNSGEMILNSGQQKTLFDIANGAATGAAQMIHLTVELAGRTLYDAMFDAADLGDLRLPKKVLV